MFDQISGYHGLAKVAHKINHHNEISVIVECNWINQFFQKYEFQMMKSLKTMDEVFWDLFQIQRNREILTQLSLLNGLMVLRVSPNFLSIFLKTNLRTPSCLPILSDNGLFLSDTLLLDPLSLASLTFLLFHYCSFIYFFKDIFRTRRKVGEMLIVPEFIS